MKRQDHSVVRKEKFHRFDGLLIGGGVWKGFWRKIGDPLLDSFEARKGGVTARVS